MSSRFPLSLDWLAETRPDLLPAVEIDGYPAVGRHEESGWDEMADLLPVVMSRLTVERQELVNAIYFQRMSIRAYARAQGVHPSSVKRQLDRTTRTLRRLIEDERNAA